MSFPSLNGLDAVIVVVLGYTLVRGAFRGLVRESLGVVAVVGAYLLAGFFYQGVEPVFLDTLPTPAIGSAVAFGLTFVAFALALMLLFRLGEHGLVRALDLGAANHAGGLVLGALKGALMVSIILFVLRAGPAGAELVEGSALARLFQPVADVLGDGFLKALPDASGRPAMPLGPI